MKEGEEGRSRRTDKGTAHVRVVGFAGQSQDVLLLTLEINNPVLLIMPRIAVL